MEHKTRLIGAIVTLAAFFTAALPVDAATRKAPKRRAASHKAAPHTPAPAKARKAKVMVAGAAAPAPAEVAAAFEDSEAAESSSSPLLQAGLQALERKDFNAAVDHLTKAARDERNSAVFFLLGWAHYQRGFASGHPDTADKKDALETVNAYATCLALDPALDSVAQPYKLYHSLGMSYEALGEYEKAVEAYRKGFVAAPRNPMLPLYASALRYRMNDLSKSAANLDIALKKAKEVGSLPAALKALTGDPQFSVMLGSEEHLAVARKYDPTIRSAAATQIAAATPAALAGGTMRDAVKGSTPAENRFVNMRRADKDVLDTLSSANDDYKFARYREAIKGYEQALKLNESSGILNPTQVGFIWERVGTSYNKLGDTDSAVKALRRCVQLAPMDSAAHYQLALAYGVIGRNMEAARALNETFKTAPSTGELRRYMLLAKTDTELEGLRDTPAFAQTLEEHQRRTLAAAR